MRLSAASTRSRRCCSTPAASARAATARARAASLLARAAAAAVEQQRRERVEAALNLKVSHSLRPLCGRERRERDRLQLSLRTFGGAAYHVRFCPLNYPLYLFWKRHLGAARVVATRARLLGAPCWLPVPALAPERGAG